MCGEHEVKGYPTLKFFTDSKEKKYDGTREAAVSIKCTDSDNISNFHIPDTEYRFFIQIHLMQISDYSDTDTRYRLHTGTPDKDTDTDIIFRYLLTAT